MNDAVFTLQRGDAPLLVSLPHVGTVIPDELRERLVPRALQVEDTDWHLDQLYDFVRGLGASLIIPRHSRYVIDLNRPPDDTPMYAGANNTGLCPIHFFTGEALYRNGAVPGNEEIEHRRTTYWRPYHDALEDELGRLRSTHGHVVLFDGHSIKSEVPWLFEGQLPDLNLGTARGTSCAPGLRNALKQVLESQTRFTHVVDGRFAGGYITRHYGRPGEGTHTVQLEMGQRCYMSEEAPYALDTRRSAELIPVLRALVETMIDWKPA